MTREEAINKLEYEIIFYPKQLVSGWYDLKISTD